MSTSEERIDRLEEKYSNLHTVVNVLANKVDNLVDEMQDFKNEVRDRDNQRAAEMRDRDNQRAAENLEIRNSIKEIYQTTDAKVSKIESKLDNVTNHIQILTVTAMAGIVAIAVAVFLK